MPACNCPRTATNRPRNRTFVRALRCLVYQVRSVAMPILKSILAVLLVAGTLAACSPTQRAAGFGAVAGGVIGGTATRSVPGAVIGAAVGTVSGAVLGTLLGRWDEDPERCVYEDRRGRRFVDDCPEG